MSINISDIQQGVVNLSGLALVTPAKNKGFIRPQIGIGQLPGPNAVTYVFHIEEENTFSLQSDVTDHYIENNTAIQDHIAIKPEIITVSGLISELTNIPDPVLEPLKTAAEKLTPLGPFLPSLSATALIAFNEAQQLYTIGKQAVESAKSAFDSLSSIASGGNVLAAIAGKTKPTQQNILFTKFYTDWKNKTLFSVQTPWGEMSDMVIMSLRATQDADTRMVSTFELTFKKLRFAETDYIAKSPSGIAQKKTTSQKAKDISQNATGRTKAAATVAENKGQVAPLKGPTFPGPPNPRPTTPPMRTG